MFGRGGVKAKSIVEAAVHIERLLIVIAGLQKVETIIVASEE